MFENLEVIHKLSENQIEELMVFYKGEAWCKDREINAVKDMLKNSWIIAFKNKADDRLVAFARVLTDFVYRAFIYDVIVDKNNRGKGYGRFLVESILNHDSIKNIERIELNCVDSNVAFYNKLGFKKVPNGTNMMRYDRSQNNT